MLASTWRRVHGFPVAAIRPGKDQSQKESRTRAAKWSVLTSLFVVVGGWSRRAEPQHRPRCSCCAGLVKKGARLGETMAKARAEGDYGD